MKLLTIYILIGTLIMAYTHSIDEKEELPTNILQQLILVFIWPVLIFLLMIDRE